MNKNQITTAAYYFPNYHLDERNQAVHGKGWTEWELMKCARPRFPGHQQPKIPLWGYEDEADPAVMEKKLAAAEKYGIDVMVFDWYWYGGKPFLERALTDGWFNVKNLHGRKFALMWANHDWCNMHPGGRDRKNEVLYPWDSTPDTIGEVWDYIIRNFMTRPEYWRVDGMPYFSIYWFMGFIKQMGGPAGAKAVLEDFRARARAAGLPGIYFSGIWYDIMEVSPEYQDCHQRDWVRLTGINSYTSYNNTHLFRGGPSDWPFIDAHSRADAYATSCQKASELPAPYFPIITVGWDVSPRTIQSDVYENLGYPFTGVLVPTPENLKYSLQQIKPYLMSMQPKERILFFNAWNEWTEGSYLEPDTVNGYGLLETIRDFLNS